MPTIADDVTFNVTSNNAIAQTVTLDGNQSANSLTFLDTLATTFTGGTGGSLTLGAGGLTKAATSGSVTFNATTAPVILGASSTITNASTSNNAASAITFGTVTGAATGAQTLTISGTGDNNNNATNIASLNNGAGGTVSLIVNSTVNAQRGAVSITGSSTYSGGTTVTKGRLTAANTQSLGTGPVTVAAGTGGNGGQLFLSLASGTGTFASNVSIAGTGTSENLGFGALRLSNGSTLGTAANTLTLTAAATVGSGPGSSIIDSLITGSGPLTISSSATAAQANGAFTITNANNYSGGTTITANPVTGTNATLGKTTLTLTGTGATLGTGNVVVLTNAISLTISTGVANGIADTATITLAGGGNAGADRGFLSLGTGVNEVVGGLFFGTGGTAVAQALGTYGATGSGATFINDEYFSGGGILTVVPEPSTWAMMLGGLGLLGTMQYLRRRRA